MAAASNANSCYSIFFARSIAKSMATAVNQTPDILFHQTMTGPRQKRLWAVLCPTSVHFEVHLGMLGPEIPCVVWPIRSASMRSGATTSHFSSSIPLSERGL